MVQRPALAVPPDPGEVEDPALARGQQLLAGELGRGVQIKPPLGAVRADDRGGEGVQVRLGAGRDLQRRRLHLHEVPGLEPGADGSQDAAPRQQERPAVAVVFGAPPGGCGGTGHEGHGPCGRSAGLAIWALIV